MNWKKLEIYIQVAGVTAVFFVPVAIYFYLVGFSDGIKWLSTLLR